MKEGEEMWGGRKLIKAKLSVFTDFTHRATLPVDTILYVRSLIHGAEPFLRSCQTCSYSRTSQHFIEPERLLPCSQEPSTGPCTEPDQSIHPISLKSILILSTHLRLGLPSGLFPSGFPTNILYAVIFSPIRAT
jgi:hypothetical protein